MKSDELYKIVGETALHSPIYIEHQGTLYEIERTEYNFEQNNWSPQTPLILITGKKSLVQLAPVSLEDLVGKESSSDNKYLGQLRCSVCGETPHFEDGLTNPHCRCTVGSSSDND